MKCKHCNRQTTWEDNKYAYGHLQINGYSPDDLKPIFPSHLKCAEKQIKDKKIQKEAN